MNNLSDNTLLQIRTIIREEVPGISSDVRSLKNGFRSQIREIHKLGVLFEDLDDRFQAVSEVG